MKKTVYKVFWAWESEKEEKWLNDQAAKGLNLVATGAFRYVFEEGEPGTYAYRLELLDNLPSTEASQEYFRFMEDVGVEQVGSIGRWVYFRKRVEDGPFELFSDIESRIKHLKRIRAIVCFAMVAELFAVAAIVPVLIHISAGFALGFALPLTVLAVVALFHAFRITRIIKRLQAERIVHE